MVDKDNNNPNEEEILEQEELEEEQEHNVTPEQRSIFENVAKWGRGARCCNCTNW